MPSNVAAATPATVLPQTLCSAFVAIWEYAINQNEYRDGTCQRDVLVSASRRRWRQSKRLAPTAMSAMRYFYLARKGPTEVFYYYDPYEPNEGQPVGSNYDPAGVSSQGRYAVRFEGEFRQQFVLGRGMVDLELVQVG